MRPGAPTEVRYALSGDVSIAYQTVGDGPIDVVVVPGFPSHLELMWQQPRAAHFYRRLSSFCRLILLDKRGSGLSDRLAPGLHRLPSGKRIYVGTLDLRDRSRAQPQIDRRPVRALHDVEGMLHHHRKFVGKGRLEIGEVRLAHADQRRVDRLVRAPFACKSDTRGRAHQQEARILIASVIERIEPARNERIIDCADR